MGSHYCTHKSYRLAVDSWSQIITVVLGALGIELGIVTLADARTRIAAILAP